MKTYSHGSSACGTAQLQLNAGARNEIEPFLEAPMAHGRHMEEASNMEQLCAALREEL